MIDARSRWVALLVAVAALAVLASGCGSTLYFDSEPIRYSAPPQPRNDCEAAFLKDLTADIGIALSPPPTPQTDAVVRVMNACTGEELLAADEYLAFGVGGMMARLSARELFNGPQRETQLADLCPV